MTIKWFQGSPAVPAAQKPVSIESIEREAFFGPQQYEADEELVDAVNTALLLDQPLLLTGEPGTGKTQLAEKLALELGIAIFKFETKSTSTAQDLLYHFDHIARFQAAQISKDEATLHPMRFIEFGALGKAIVQSLSQGEAMALFAGSEAPDWYKGGERAVVLIDEIDKAPSDFPNDVLNEVERHYFRIREMDGGREVQASGNMRPIIVITSNSDKQLPDAFLRRCIFHHLRPITPERLQRIALGRLGSRKLSAGRLLQDALDFFFELRQAKLDLRKPPSTAEFLGFIAALCADPEAKPEAGLSKAMVRRWLSVLVKAPEDQDSVHKLPRLAD